MRHLRFVSVPFSGAAVGYVAASETILCRCVPLDMAVRRGPWQPPQAELPEDSPPPSTFPFMWLVSPFASKMTLPDPLMLGWHPPHVVRSSFGITEEWPLVFGGRPWQLAHPVSVDVQFGVCFRPVPP